MNDELREKYLDYVYGGLLDEARAFNTTINITKQEEEILNMKPGREMDALVAEKVIGCHKVIKKYSTDISTALEVVGKFPRYEIEKDWDGTLWCSLIDERANRFIGCGYTLPEAICKAALISICYV